MTQLKGRRPALDPGGRPWFDAGGRLVFVKPPAGVRLADGSGVKLTAAELATADTDPENVPPYTVGE